jgi:large subunit ribosomal protein L17
MLRNLVRSLVRYEGIITTEQRAKEARKLAEKLITTARADTLHARRQVRAFLQVEDRLPSEAILRQGRKIITKKKGLQGRYSLNEELVSKVYNIVPRLKSEAGGYTRITRLGPRRGDAAMMVKLEFVFA